MCFSLILQEEKQREVFAPPIFSNNPPSAIAVKNTNMITSSKVPRCAHYGILIRPHSRQMFYKKISKPADSDIGNCWLSLTKQCSWSQFHKCFKSHGIVLSINPNSFMFSHDQWILFQILRVIYLLIHNYLILKY